MTETETKVLPIALLQPLVSRVRTDVHWAKLADGHPVCVKKRLTDTALNVHLNGRIPVGACPIKAGESTTRVAVLDLDSHKGETSWEDMCGIVEQFPFQAADLRPIIFSSSGGKGIHVYLIWDEPQDAYSVREFLRSLLQVNGYSDGAGGVSNNQIEIFPKQDSVPLDGFGNMFILPYSGESVPLEPQLDYQRMPKDYPVEWPVSVPVPVVAKPERVAPAAPKGLDQRLTDALGSMDPSPLDYDTWLRIGQAVHHETEGSIDGFVLWDGWSSKSEKYTTIEFSEARWESFGKSSAQPVTAGTIYKMATEAGWIDTPSADDFEVLPLEEVAVVNPLRFPILNSLSFAAGKQTPWIIKGILPEADLAVIYGETASGKSFFTLDMVCAVARGIPWQGRKVKQGRVLYIIAEGSGGFRNRINAYVAHHKLTELAVDVISAAPNFLEKKDISDLIASIQVMDVYSIIVVDTWAQVTPGSNENSGEDMGKALAHCRKLRQATGAMTMLIHHSGKDATRGARGWSGLRAAADCEISIERDEESRVATITKLKDGDDGLKFGFKLVTVVVGADEDGDPMSSCLVEEAEVVVSPNKEKEHRTGSIERKVLDVVGDYYDEHDEWPESSVVIGILKEMGIKPNNIDRAIQGLITKGRLVEERGRLRKEDEDDVVQ